MTEKTTTGVYRDYRQGPYLKINFDLWYLSAWMVTYVVEQYPLHTTESPPLDIMLFFYPLILAATDYVVLFMVNSKYRNC